MVSKGQTIRFNEGGVRPMGRARRMRGMKLREGTSW
jgi:hypothetical protein